MGLRRVTTWCIYTTRVLRNVHCSSVTVLCVRRYVLLLLLQPFVGLTAGCFGLAPSRALVPCVFPLVGIQSNANKNRYGKSSSVTSIDEAPAVSAVAVQDAIT